jgi:hypothetical protein
MWGVGGGEDESFDLIECIADKPGVDLMMLQGSQGRAETESPGDGVQLECEFTLHVPMGGPAQLIHFVLECGFGGFCAALL